MSDKICRKMGKEIYEKLKDEYLSSNGRKKLEIAQEMKYLTDVLNISVWEKPSGVDRDAKELDTQQILEVLRTEVDIKDVSTNGYWFKFNMEGIKVEVINQFGRLLVRSYKKLPTQIEEKEFLSYLFSDKDFTNYLIESTQKSVEWKWEFLPRKKKIALTLKRKKKDFLMELYEEALSSKQKEAEAFARDLTSPIFYKDVPSRLTPLEEKIVRKLEDLCDYRDFIVERENIRVDRTFRHALDLIKSKRSDYKEIVSWYRNLGYADKVLLDFEHEIKYNL